MTDEHPGDPEDGVLRDALARLDPAAALTPADPARTARLVEDTMAAPETDPTHSRTPLLAAIVAVVVLLAAVAGFSALRDDTPPDEPAASATGEATPSSASTPSPEAATVLTAPEATAARCPMPTAAVLAGASVAVAGTVQSITDGVATVAVDEVFAGDPGTTLEIQAPSAEFRERLAAVELQDGGRYLLAGTDDGRLLVCGFSGAYDADLLALYEQAFPQ